MLTVKHICLDGSEAIHETSECRYEMASSDNDRTAMLWIDRDAPVIGGTAFVMNSSGKTIARYDLGATIVPLPDIDRVADALRMPRDMVV